MVFAAQAPEPPPIPKSCRFVAVKSARPQTTDPTSFEDDSLVVLAPGRYVAIEGVRVTMRRGKRLLGSATLDRLSTSGGVVRLLPPPGQAALSVGKGPVRIRVTGTRAASCPTRKVDHTGSWRFDSPTLPVRAAPATTFVEDARRSGIRLYLRSVGERVVRTVRATLLNSAGKAVASAPLDGPLRDGATLDVPVPADLAAGRYQVRYSGRPPDSTQLRTWYAPLFLGSRGGDGQPPVDDVNGLSQQHVVVDWSKGQAAGRDTAGFVAPGIGYGEIVCGYQQQHIRFYPNDLGREQSMMLWTYKDWGEGTEKAIRENVHTQFVGPSFQEGLNKWSPPDHRSTGLYEGLIVDRGVLDAPFGSSLAPATSIELTWEWDFTETRQARCHVDATLRTENGDPTPNRPLARTAQVVWRGDSNADGHDTATVDVPGVGTVSVLCQRSPDGTRALTVDPATQGGSVIVRQGGDETQTDLDRGPLVVPLPNNGQVKLGLFDGASVLVTSRWKVNDPKPGENWCKVAAQVVVR